MILKGSQRGSGADLAVHLMNGFDNERVQIAEIYGTVAGDLLGAFAEFEAVARGTKAEKYLYSLSINPSAPLTREQYHEAIQDIENRLGLTDQPRAVVFHIKGGREHCHVVWSRIDVERMKAIHMAHDRRKLMDMACELARKYGLELPPGLKAWEEKQKYEKDQLEATLGEKAQEEKTGISPEQRREEITACYEQADTAAAFIQALEQKGYVLARGDRRGFVIVDEFSDVHNLTRYVKGHKARDIRARLAPLKPEDLPGVDQAKDMQRRRKRAQEEKEGEGERRQAEERHRKAQDALAAKQAARQAELRRKEQELLTRQQAEKLSLHEAQKSESAGALFRLRRAVSDLIGRAPGLRSVLGPIQKLTHLDPRERHDLERFALARRHGREKREFERQKRLLSRIETREKQSMEKALRRNERLIRELGGKVRQDFYEAARDQGLWRAQDYKMGELRVSFNDAAEFVQGPPDSGGDDDDRAPNWKQRAEESQRGHRPRRGKGYGHRRSKT